MAVGTASPATVEKRKQLPKTEMARGIMVLISKRTPCRFNEGWEQAREDCRQQRTGD